MSHVYLISTSSFSGKEWNYYNASIIHSTQDVESAIIQWETLHHRSSVEIIRYSPFIIWDHVDKKSRIVPRHITLAVKNDEELNKLLSGVTIASGGVLPNIHAYDEYLFLPVKIHVAIYTFSLTHFYYHYSYLLQCLIAEKIKG